MGTRADFYIKKADTENLIWLGSTAWDGYPDGIEKDVINAKGETEYLAALKERFTSRRDVTMPQQGWPWPWDDSRTTDFAYCFHEGKVYANCFGRGWFDPLQEDEEAVVWYHAYPDMKDIKNVRMDSGSGLIVITSTGIIPK